MTDELTPSNFKPPLAKGWDKDEPLDQLPDDYYPPDDAEPIPGPFLQKNEARPDPFDDPDMAARLRELGFDSVEEMDEHYEKIFHSAGYELGLSLGAYQEREEAAAAFREGRIEQWVDDTEAKTFEGWEYFERVERPKRIDALLTLFLSKHPAHPANLYEQDRALFREAIELGERGYYPTKGKRPSRKKAKPPAQRDLEDALSEATGVPKERIHNINDPDWSPLDMD